MNPQVRRPRLRSPQSHFGEPGHPQCQGEIRVQQEMKPSHVPVLTAAHPGWLPAPSHPAGVGPLPGCAAPQTTAPDVGPRERQGQARLRSQCGDQLEPPRIPDSDPSTRRRHPAPSRPTVSIDPIRLTGFTHSFSTIEGSIGPADPQGQHPVPYFSGMSATKRPSQRFVWGWRWRVTGPASVSTRRASGRISTTRPPTTRSSNRAVASWKTSGEGEGKGARSLHCCWPGGWRRGRSSGEVSASERVGSRHKGQQPQKCFHHRASREPSYFPVHHRLLSQ